MRYGSTMRLTLASLTLLVAVSPVCAQEPVDKPYQEGNVHAFLDTARSNDRPAVVLFNFDREAG